MYNFTVKNDGPYKVRIRQSIIDKIELIKQYSRSSTTWIQHISSTNKDDIKKKLLNKLLVQHQPVKTSLVLRLRIICYRLGSMADKVNHSKANNTTSLSLIPVNINRAAYKNILGVIEQSYQTRKL